MRLDALTTREYEKDGETKTAWTKVGVAFQNRNSDGYTLFLECYPVPDKDGKVKISLLPPRENDGGSSDYQDRKPRKDIDQSPPF